MRISDWSSDVCSSDLVVEVLRAEIERAVQELAVAFHEFPVALAGRAVVDALHQRQLVDHAAAHHAALDQQFETLVDHLAAAVQALFERPQATAGRSEAPREGQECVSTCKYGGAP